MNELPIGKVITDTNQERDAIHIAIQPVTVNDDTFPGAQVGIERVREDGEVIVSEVAVPKVGIIDPFIEDEVLGHQRCFLFLFPNTVTSLKHYWEHPAFENKPVQKIKYTKDPNDKSWRTQTVIDICESILKVPNHEELNDEDIDDYLYSRNYKDLPVLADALEDAGYTDDKVLSKMRSSGLYGSAGLRLVSLVYSDETEAAVRWIEDFADEIDLGFNSLMDSAAEYSHYGEYIDNGSNEGYNNATRAQWQEFWRNYKILTGFETKQSKDHAFFSCSC